MANNNSTRCDKSCPWNSPDASDDDPDTAKLRRGHLAEYEGLSVSELDRMESEQWAELQ